MIIKRTLITVIIGLAFILPGSVFATVNPGDLIKLQSDGNPATQHDAAVYYVGNDNKRYVFPNDKVFFSWYANFSLVREVTSGEMSSLQIGGNITYRPGTRLIKITSDPKVYAVEPGGLIRPIADETVATQLYGENWNKIIDDVSDAYFVNYSVGSALAANVYPTGVVVQRSSDNALYYIQNGTKRHIANEQVMNDLRIQSKYIVRTNSSLAEYPDGDAVASAESSLSDTAQKTIVPQTSTPTISVTVPSSNYIAVGTDATLLEIRITAGSPVTLTNILAKIDATTDETRAEGEVDDDEGGLVFGNNAQRNLDLIRFVDSAGTEVFGRKSPALDVNQDQSQSFNYSGSLNIPAGTEKILYLKARVNDLMPSEQGFRVTLPIANIQFRNQSGESADFLPLADLVGPSLLTLAERLEVSLSSTYGNQTAVKGSQKINMTGFNLKATTYAPNVIKSITFQGYINENETGGGGFLPGADADNGTETLMRDMFTGVYLYDSDDNLIAGPGAFDINGKLIFSNLAINIPAGQQKIVVIKVDVSKTIDLEQNPNYVSIDIVNASEDVEVIDQFGNSVLSGGINSNGGVTPTTYLTVRNQGEMDISWGGLTTTTIAGTEQLLGSFDFEPEYDDYVLNMFALSNTGSGLESSGNLRWETTVNGTTYTGNSEFIGTIATFSGLNVPLPRDVKTTLKVYMTTKSKTGGAVYGDVITVNWDTSGSFVFKSVTTDEVYNASNLQTPFYTIVRNVTSGLTVRYSNLTANKATDSPTGDIYRDGQVEVLKFSLSADEAGPVRVKRLSFKLKPTDAGTAGPNNDALEYWANLEGDFQDDDSILNLKRVVLDGTDQILAEGSSGRVRYSVVSGGVNYTAPADRESQSADFGVVQMEFPDNNEFFIPAGGTADFILELNTIGFASGSNYQLEVQLMTDANALWTDISSGAYTPLTGSQAIGFGLLSNLRVMQ